MVFRLFAVSLIILLCGIVLQIIGVQFNLYGPTTHFDKLMHLVGGLGAGVGMMTLTLFFISFKKIGSCGLFCLTFIWAIVVGVLWEILQNVFNIYTVVMDYRTPDTITDVLADTIGGLIAGLVVVYIYRKHRTTT
jgi:membrane associated rhomboid family serine protease